MVDTGVGSNVVFPRSVLALIGREVHVLVLRMREVFHRCKFPALGNAFTHVCDNCELTSRTRNGVAKINNKACKCFQYLPCAAQLQTIREKKRGN